MIPFKKLFINMRKHSQSQETLKTLVDKVDRKDVVDYAFNYISNYNLDEIKDWVFTDSSDIKLTKKFYLQEVCDEIYELSKVDYENSKTSNYLLKVTDKSPIPFGFEEFYTIEDLILPVESTDCFLMFAQAVDPLPIEFYLNVPIDRSNLLRSNIELLGKGLLQIAYMKEVDEDS